MALKKSVPTNNHIITRGILQGLLPTVDSKEWNCYRVYNWSAYRLQRIQNCVARLIMKKRKYDHITPFIYELHWLPLEFWIQYKLAVLAFQHFEGTLPTYLSAMLCMYESARSLRSSTERLLKSPRVNPKSAGECSFHFAAPAVWNSLPNSLHNIHSLSQFKKQLKTHLFCQAFLDSQM